MPRHTIAVRNTVEHPPGLSDGFGLLRCPNHADDPETCGDGCGLVVSMDDDDAERIISALADGWLELIYVNREQRAVSLLYCSGRCIARHQDRLAAVHIALHGHREGGMP